MIIIECILILLFVTHSHLHCKNKCIEEFEDKKLNAAIALWSLCILLMTALDWLKTCWFGAFYSCFTIVNQFRECTSICLNDLFLEKFQVDQFNVSASSSSILCKLSFTFLMLHCGHFWYQEKIASYLLLKIFFSFFFKSSYGILILQGVQ